MHRETVAPSVTGSLGYIAAPVPAVVVGAILMSRDGVSAGLWLQQIGAALVGTLVCAGVFFTAPRPAAARTRVVVAAAAVVLVAATLGIAGMDGVRRWVPLGPLQLHASAVALPMLVLAMGVAGRRDGPVPRRGIEGLAVAAAVLLVAQPDASQATALAGAALTILLLEDRSSARAWLICAVLVGLAALAWTRADPLSPVPHVEEIVDLAARLGVAWHAAALLALGLIPLPFIVAAFRGVSPPVCIGTGIYFAILCIAPAFGAYPVPLMGYGLSYVLGYYAALAWLVAQGAASQERVLPARARAM